MLLINDHKGIKSLVFAVVFMRQLRAVNQFEQPFMFNINFLYIPCSANKRVVLLFNVSFKSDQPLHMTCFHHGETFNWGATKL